MLSVEKSDPTPIPPEFWSLPLALAADVVAPRSEDPKLITRVITFELFQPIRPRYLNVTDGQTDRRTDGRLTIAIRGVARNLLGGKRGCLGESRSQQGSGAEPSGGLGAKTPDAGDTC